MDQNYVNIKNKNKNVIAKVVYAIILVVAVLITAIGSAVYYRVKYMDSNPNLKLEAILKELSANYYEEIDESKLYDGAVRGMVEGLDDPYSTYMDAEQVTDFYQALENEFVGIGIALEDASEGAYITKVFKNSPAEKSGLAVGDLISKVDGEDMLGQTATDVATKARGLEGTDVEITVVRAGYDDEVVYTIKRAQIEIADLTYKMLDDKIGYIQIVDFTSDIYKQFEDAYKELSSKGMESLIIDVRNNGGGYLNQVISIVDLFVDDSKPIYKEKIKDKITKEEFGDKKKYDIEVAVLINKNSASASELLAASLSEINGSELIGVTTFGKGTAQTSNNYKDGSAIKYTYAQWLTPNGNWIHNVGIAPTVKEELSEIYSYRKVLISEPIGIDTVNEQTKNAQLILKELGYDVRVDGYFDKDTEEVIKKFQTENDLKVTGQLNSDTATKLDNIFSKYLDDYQNDNQIMKAIEVLKGE